MFTNLTTSEEESTAFPVALPGMEISPRVEEFKLVMGNFSSDLEKFVLNLNFKRNKYIYLVYGEFLRVFLILEQPTWQHCFPGYSVVVDALL